MLTYQQFAHILCGMEFRRHGTPEEIVIRLKKLIKKIEQVHAFDETSEITHAQARIIMPIAKLKKGQTLQELAEYGGVDKALVSRVIADLEEKGLVEREGESTYKYKIKLSEKGEKIVSERIMKHKEAFIKLRGKITREELSNFIKVLEKLTDD